MHDAVCLFALFICLIELAISSTQIPQAATSSSTVIVPLHHPRLLFTANSFNRLRSLPVALISIGCNHRRTGCTELLCTEIGHWVSSQSGAAALACCCSQPLVILLIVDNRFDNPVRLPKNDDAFYVKAGQSVVVSSTERKNSTAFGAVCWTR